jgi:uncharacterized membrane protein
VPLIARDHLIPHAHGVFAATFLYAIAAISGVDYAASGHVPVLSLCGVIALLVATMAMLIGLVQRIGLLQVSHVLRLTGDEGPAAIARTDGPIQAPVVTDGVVCDRRSGPGVHPSAARVRRRAGRRRTAPGERCRIR